MHPLQAYSLSHRLFDVFEGLDSMALPATTRIRRSCSVSCDLLWHHLSLQRLLFTALHTMQGGVSHEKCLSVCPSVLLSNA